MAQPGQSDIVWHQFMHHTTLQLGWWLVQVLFVACIVLLCVCKPDQYAARFCKRLYPHCGQVQD